MKFTGTIYTLLKVKEMEQVEMKGLMRTVLAITANKHGLLHFQMENKNINLKQ